LAREAGEQRQAKAGQGQVELCGWASALSAYLAGEALTDRIEESSGEQWRAMDCGPLSTLAPKTRDEDGQDGEHHRAPCVSSLAGSREDRGLVFFIEQFQLM
jgi:hypothetical protein